MPINAQDDSLRIACALSSCHLNLGLMGTEKTKKQVQKYWSRFLELSDELGQAKDWNSLSPQAKRLVLGLIGYVVFEKAFTWHHVYHTPENRLRGNRKAWFVVTWFADVVGPLAFFLFGRKPKDKKRNPKN